MRTDMATSLKGMEFTTVILLGDSGVSLLPLEKTLEMAKKIVELPTGLTVDAIAKGLGGPGKHGLPFPPGIIKV